MHNTLPWMFKPDRPDEKIVFRAKFSAISANDIRNAMNALVDPNENEALAVDARQELDLKMGSAFTRFQCLYFQGKYGNLNSRLISYGPCMTPTLAFAVNRFDEIQTFKPQTYWVVEVVISPTTTCSSDLLTESNAHSSPEHNQNAISPNHQGEIAPIVLSWSRGRVFNKEIGKMFLNICKLKSVSSNQIPSNFAIVDRVEVIMKKFSRPLPLNTVELLKVASKALGIGPGETMHIAESLYIEGYISYPRTETSSYPANFDIQGVLMQHKNNSQWGAYVTELLFQGLNQPKHGIDNGDHPPITPVRSADQTSIGGNKWRVYEYITRHFIATVSQDCSYEHTSVHFLIGEAPFQERFQVILFSVCFLSACKLKISQLQS
jgi:DNA topoisomerase-3